MTEFDGGGPEFFPELDCMQEKRFLDLLIISQNAAKVKEGHGYEPVTEEEVFKMDKRKETEDLDAGWWMAVSRWS